MVRAPRRFRIIPIALVAALLIGVFVLAKGENVDARGTTALLAVAWWVSPLGLYYAICITRFGAIAIGGTYLAAVGAFVSAIYNSTGSTAAVGFITVPFVLWVGIVAALIAENVLLRTRIRSRP
jgi:hypothetical protein